MKEFTSFKQQKHNKTSAQDLSNSQCGRSDESPRMASFLPRLVDMIFDLTFCHPPGHQLTGLFSQPVKPVCVCVCVFRTGRLDGSRSLNHPESGDSDLHQESEKKPANQIWKRAKWKRKLDWKLQEPAKPGLRGLFATEKKKTQQVKSRNDRNEITDVCSIVATKVNLLGGGESQLFFVGGEFHGWKLFPLS